MLVAGCMIAAVLLIALNGFFSLSEVALVRARRPKLQELADDGDPKAARVLELDSDSGRLFATIQVAITLVGFAISAVVATTVSVPVATWLASLGIPWLAAASGFIAVVFVTLAAACLTLVFGELVPKRAAMSDSEKVAMRVAGTLMFLERIVRPLALSLSFSAKAFSRIFGIKSGAEQRSVSEEEIKILVNEHDDLLEEEKRMIGEIFDMGDTVAREIMVPRVDMVTVPDEMAVRQVIERMRATGFSRLPVFHEDHDSIVGIAMVKDLLVPLMDGREDESIARHMRTPVFVPETKDILPLLSEMQSEHTQMVIVVDEYGGTAGLLSVEDIVEEVVGEISDEYDPVRKLVTRISDTEVLADGRLSVDEAIREGIPIEESDEYDTVAGWLMDAIDYIPSVGDMFEIGGMKVCVKSMRRERISLLSIRVLDRLGDAAGSGDGDGASEGGDIACGGGGAGE